MVGSLEDSRSRDYGNDEWGGCGDDTSHRHPRGVFIEDLVKRALVAWLAPWKIPAQETAGMTSGATAGMTNRRGNCGNDEQAGRLRE